MHFHHHPRHWHRRMGPIGRFVRFRLRRRIFVWFAGGMVMTGFFVTVVLMLVARVQAPEWSQSSQRGQQWVGQQFARDWPDAARRNAYARETAEALDMNLQLFDAEGRSVYEVGDVWRPYFPDGPLRGALAYPQPASTYSDEALIQALNDALMPLLTSRLDDVDAWSQKLSGGEQQRLAIARVLLKKPKWILADEATASLDEVAEKSLYEKLQAHVQSVHGGMVSIAHRPSVAAFHNVQWELVKHPDGAGAPAVPCAPFAVNVLKANH